MTLCIVDMQPYFATSDKVVEQVEKEVAKAIKNREGIVILEYARDGIMPYDGLNDSRTHSAIIKLVKNYDRHTIVKKFDDGGGKELFKALNIHKFNKKRLKFVGVNACYCVTDTLWETSTYLEDSKFEVINGAVNCSCWRDTCAEHLVANFSTRLDIKLINRRK